MPAQRDVSRLNSNPQPLPTVTRRRAILAGLATLAGAATARHATNQPNPTARAHSRARKGGS